MSANTMSDFRETGKIDSMVMLNKTVHRSPSNNSFMMVYRAGRSMLVPKKSSLECIKGYESRVLGE